MPINPGKSETEEEFIGRCMSEETQTYESDQAYAICKSKWDSENMSKHSSPYDRVNARFNSLRIKQELIQKFEAQPSIDSSYSGEPASGSVEMAESEIDVFGYQTKQFYICPGAIGTFEDLKSQTNLNEDTIGMIRSAAQLADNVFGIEKDAIESGSTTQEKLDEATVIVADFQDLMGEIESEIGKDYDTSYMDGHLVTIKSFL